MMTTKFLATDTLRGTGSQVWELMIGSISRGLLTASQLTHALRARREITALRHFSDRELRDIGLHRNDVESALSLPLHQDPSRKLAALIATKGVEG